MNSAPQSWAPPFCPNPKCRFHRGDTTLWRHVQDRLLLPQDAAVQDPASTLRHLPSNFRRFDLLCPPTGCTAPSCWCPVFHRLVSCSGLRQIATEFKASPETIARLAGRLGRHALLYHQLNRPKSRLRTPRRRQLRELRVQPVPPDELPRRRREELPLLLRLHRQREAEEWNDEAKKQRRKRANWKQALAAPIRARSSRTSPTCSRSSRPQPQKLELHTDEHRDYPRAARRLKHLEIDSPARSPRARRARPTTRCFRSTCSTS